MAGVCVTVATVSYAANPADHLRSGRQLAAEADTASLNSPQRPASQDAYTSTSQSQVRDDITPAELIAFLRQLERRVNTNTQAISDTSVHTQTLRVQLAEIKDQLEKNHSEQLRLLEAQQDVINSVTRTDAIGRHALRVDANTANRPGSAKDLSNDVNQTRPTHGTLTIRNPLNHAQTVDVNGQLYRITAGSRKKLTVPVGNVVTRVPSGKVYTWFIGAPNYEMLVKLAAPDSVVTQRPVTESAPHMSTPLTTVADDVTLLPPLTVIPPTEWKPVENAYFYAPSF